MSRDPWREYKAYDPNEQRKDWDRAQGNRRWEVLINVKSIFSLARRIFGKKEKS